MDEDDLQGFERYLVGERQLGERTIKVYLIFYNLFDPIRLSQEYINDFVIEHHNTTIVRAFIKHYLTYQCIPEMFKLPTRTLGKKSQRVIRSITDNELNIVRDYFYNSSFKHGLIFDMIRQGAMRRVEIITITLGSFFWNEWLENNNDFCKLVILGKGKKQRIVLINPETAESILNQYIKLYDLNTIDLIKSFLSRNKDVYLFVSPNGQPMKEKQVYDIVKKLSFKALGRDIRPHELRHHRATELQKRGVPIGDIRNYLGHTKLTTTEIYLHKSGEDSLSEIKEKLLN